MTVKKSFSKISYSIVLKRLKPSTVPPEPINTRWNTWLGVVECYSNNFEKIKEFISNLDSDTVQSILQKLQTLCKIMT